MSNDTQRARSTAIGVLDPLRGMAALSVCLFHLTRGNREFLPASDPLAILGAPGWLGVEAFFVISGFVIPYSLSLQAYRHADCWRFLAGRLRRLTPPYLASIALVLVLGGLSYLAPGFRGPAPVPHWPQILAHLGYLNGILGLDWLNPVYWTLAIELQFYLMMAIVQPLLIHHSRLVRTAAPLAFALLGTLGERNEILLTAWLPLFVQGMLVCQRRLALLDNREFVVLFAAVSVAGLYSTGKAETMVAAVTAMVILLAPAALPATLAPLGWIGRISYSIYLVHVPIGGRVINLATRLPDSTIWHYGALMLALLLSVGCAAIFSSLIEAPSIRWSKRSR